ncbi:MAG: ABC transporter permease [Oscillospiraceae bacterium]|nr:ABC transporter permease [Oscillospiraceae bacterium]
MYILKNAFLNIKSAKGRNILIAIIVLVIAVSSCISLSVKQSAKTAEEEGLKNLSISASISVDRSKLMQNAQNSGQDARTQMQSVQQLTLEEMQTYAQSESVKEFLYTLTASVNGFEVDPVSDEDTSEEETTTQTPSDAQTPTTPGGNMQQDGMGGRGNFLQGDFSVVGYNSYSAMSDFVSGGSKITSGEIFDVTSDSNVCVISEELAAFNSLAVGDTIMLTNPDNEEQYFTFTITGVYSYTSTSSSDEFGRNFSTAMDPANRIYTSYTALNKFIAYTKENAEVTTDDNGREQTTALSGTTSGTYLFASVEDYEAFAEDAKTMGLGDSYTVSSSDLSSYEESLVPIQNTAKFANLMLWVVLAVGGAILVVLNIFNIRERKYEVGVLTAIGMKKRKVATQFVAELLAVTLIAIVAGSGVGAVLSVPVSDALLASQIEAQETKESEQSESFGRPGQSMQGAGGGTGSSQQSFGNSAQVDYITTLSAKTDFWVLGQLMAIGILLTFFASLVAVVFVMRYEPLKILSERA